MAGSTGRKISTFIELGGEQAFKKAVSDAARSVQVLNAGMKAATAEFEATGDAQTYLTNKAETLRAKMEEQKKYIDLLNYGMDEYVAMGEKGAKKADEQAIKIANATVALQKMKAELEDVESGETAFQHEMKQAEAQMGALDASLKALESEYKATGNATQYFADKNTLLHSRIAQQESIVKELDDAVRRSASRYGEASAETEQYRAKLATATAKLFDMRRELETADREAEEFGRDSVKVGRQIENGIGDGAEEAQKSMKGLIEQMQEDIGSIKGSVGFSVTSQIVTMVKGVYQWVENTVNEGANQAYKLENLKTAAKIRGYNFDDIMEIVYELTGQIGDQDEAMEAATSLMQTEMDIGWIKNAAKQLETFSIKYGEEAKVADVAADLMKSVRNGKAEGKFLDIIKMQGGKEATANTLLEQTDDISKRAIAMLTYTSRGKDNQKVEEAKEERKNISDLSESQAKLDNEIAEFAKAAAPAVTKKNEFFSEIIKGLKTTMGLWFGDDETKKQIMEEAEAKNKELEEAYRNNVKEWFNGWFERGKDQAYDAEEAGKETGDEVAEGAKKALEDARPTVQDIIASWWATDGTDEEKAEAVRKLIDQMKPTTEEIAELTEVFSQIGADINLIFGTVEENSGTSGSNAGTSFGNGFRAAMGTVVRDAWTYANQINAALASIGSGLGNVPIYGGGYHLNGAAGGGNLNIGLTSNINLNGRRLAQVVDSYQGKKANRLS